MPEEFVDFNKVYLIVHPFFAMENARVKPTVASLKNATPSDLFEDYLEMNTINGWKRMIEKAKKEPRSIVMIIGPQEQETQVPRRFFFSGSLTKQKLATFTKEYQQFLHEAKRTAGKKLFYISHTIADRKKIVQLWKTMVARKMVPSREVLVIGSGEYLGTKKKPYCVNGNTDTLKDVINNIQKSVWKDKPTRVRAGIKVRIRANGKRSKVSLEHQDYGMVELVRELRKSGAITPEFLLTRLKHKENSMTALKKTAEGYNRILKKYVARRR